MDLEFFQDPDGFVFNFSEKIYRCISEILQVIILISLKKIFNSL